MGGSVMIQEFALTSAAEKLLYIFYHKANFDVLDKMRSQRIQHKYCSKHMWWAGEHKKKLCRELT